MRLCMLCTRPTLSAGFYGVSSLKQPSAGRHVPPPYRQITLHTRVNQLFKSLIFWSNEKLISFVNNKYMHVCL